MTLLKCEKCLLLIVIPTMCLHHQRLCLFAMFFVWFLLLFIQSSLYNAKRFQFQPNLWVCEPRRIGVNVNVCVNAVNAVKAIRRIWMQIFIYWHCNTPIVILRIMTEIHFESKTIQCEHCMAKQFKWHECSGSVRCNKRAKKKKNRAITKESERESE